VLAVNGTVDQRSRDPRMLNQAMSEKAEACCAGSSNRRLSWTNASCRIS
jgi:hypothetical protein